MNSVTLILREIKFGESRVSKSTILKRFYTLNCYIYEFFHILKSTFLQLFVYNFPDDKSDPQSGSESCGSDDLSHQSSPNVSSSTILSAFTSHGNFTTTFLIKDCPYLGSSFFSSKYFFSC